MISINSNLSAMNTANNLRDHYSKLQISTQRLSSGLRINSAADDAAGLAIRELMRSDIAALRQGMRNVNDGISMIQTFDGALGVIDEKLIRMKELAEQAATGTYDSTQRLMIDSEFQAMGAEIDRIARATEFNGIKLLDGKGGADTVAGQTKMAKAIARTVTGSDGKDYDINIVSSSNSVVWPGSTASGSWDTSGIKDPSKIRGRTDVEIINENIPRIGNNFLLITPQGQNTNIPQGSTITFNFDGTKWSINGQTHGNPPGTILFGDENGFFYQEAAGGSGIVINTTFADQNGNVTSLPAGQVATSTWTAPTTIPAFSVNNGTIQTKQLNGNNLTIEIDLDPTITDPNQKNILKGTWVVNSLQTADLDKALASAKVSLEIKEKVVAPPTPEEPTGPTDPDNPLSPNYKIPDDVVRIHFGTGADKKEDFYDIRKYDATCKGLGLTNEVARGVEGERIDIQTQERAQEALVKISDAIVAKDKIRADYGAMQNRMENTLANLSIQQENLQAAESRISDTEIAQEMMTFVRQQILTQSAVAMLAQANSLPQMVMRLIG